MCPKKNTVPVSLSCKLRAKVLIQSSKPCEFTSVIPLGGYEIATRDMSCHCTECLTDVRRSSCLGWRIHSLKAVDSEPVEVGQYVVAIYDNKMYVGMVEDVDASDGDARITFMKESSKTEDVYVWPSTKDEIWLPFKDILFPVDEPIPFGKSKRMYKLKIDDASKMRNYI